ncbi:5-(carboxyamino)imidazole ribonucleotide mutase [Alkaliphilus sp. MSJ-5]|uniref:N5-carboxyaminoimidazole ribonucleotide mutase n=1 Tax=Alkaliphilus flagellatus TaxID=2841507 RepID=A0ABS6G6A8_9FIRM|nr:5-(carboxyamino)imidazole ribonucleotide mutase [Alkaliphilus flagellatus]MBU5678005.1 5-(carboxyamino)imidazole ribonucleotide mutase [Alkaliphilus flagellatus]
MKNPIVSIIMGSDSDLPIMKNAAEILDKLGVLYELTIVSAHRTPERMFSFAKGAADRGIKVIIAGAGGAAHLPGMVASITHIPVIGVPIKSKALDGIDSLYSIVQMPSGVPVATVGINGGANAGILAAQIISIVDENVRKKLINYKSNLTKAVEEKAKKLEEIGYKNY